MEATLKTHVGHIRQVNEDYAELIFNQQNIFLALVADGMGGHQAGDIASKMAVTQIKEAFLELEEAKDKEGWSEWLVSILQKTNRSIYEFSLTHSSYHGMGTTLVALLLSPKFYIIAHVGDSRCYRFTEQTVEVMTKDHSLVNELLSSGQITMEEAAHHPQRNVITRALGTEESIEVDIKRHIYTTEKYFLLCSDGLSNYIHEDEMIQLISQDKTLETKATTLLQMALDLGGDDNITFILVKLDGEST